MRKKKFSKKILTAPITRWDEALPLGNGLTGALLWGQGRSLILSLDRGDLWDERRQPDGGDTPWTRAELEKIVLARDAAAYEKLEDMHLNMLSTKLPAGRLEISAGGTGNAAVFELDIHTAEASVRDEKGNLMLKVFAAADGSGIFLESGNADAEIRIVPPDYDSWKTKADELFTLSPARLGYEQGVLTEGKDFSSYVQKYAGDRFFAVCVKHLGGGRWKTEILKSDSGEEIECLLESRRNAGSGVSELMRARRAHRRYWRKFFQRSQIDFDDAEVEENYLLARYFLGSASRRGAPPAPLQGVWTADDGTLPPWRGDYHHDANTELTYISYLVSGDWENGECLFDHLFSQLDVYCDFARRFFDRPGAAVPGTASLAGRELGGWPPYSFSPTTAAWLGAMFVRHYRYTLSEDFLRQKAYPFVLAAAEFLESMLQSGGEGKLHLRFSSSPEYLDNSFESYFEDFSNYDLALTRELFSGAAYLASECGEKKTEKHFAALLERLPGFAVSEENGFKISAEHELGFSHRHFSHLLMLYPFSQLDMRDEKNRRDALNSLHRIDTLGTGEWVGYSFVWMAATAARLGMGERALRYLRDFMRCFLSRNGFHLNGDYRDLGCSRYKYRPFTLESNFFFMECCHELLLQSHGGVVRVFPATPGEWKNVSFRNLRAEQGLSVTATKKDGKLTELVISASHPVDFILEADFGGGVRQIEVKMAPGESRSFR